MNSKRKFLVLSFVCFILFSVAPVSANNTTDNGSGNSTNNNNTINSTVVPLTVDFSADVTNGIAPLNVLFTATCTGNPTEFKWTFGDGTSSIQLNKVGHTYMHPGKYDVSLKITNANGSNTTSKLGYITVNANNTSNPVITNSCVSSINNNTKNVTNNVTNNVTSNVTNNVTTNNTIKSACNSTKSIPTNLRVLCCGKAPNRVHFIDRSKNHISYYWDFGDGNTSKSKSVTHIYKTPGKYLVKLTYKTKSHYTKTLYGGYIVVTGSSIQSLNNTSNTSQSTLTPTSTPVPTPTAAVTPTPTPNPIATPTPTPTSSTPDGTNNVCQWDYKYSLTSHIGSYYTAPPGYNYAVVNLYLKNGADQSVSTNPFYWNFVADGIKYTFDVATYDSSINHQTVDVRKGGEIEVQFVYVVKGAPSQVSVEYGGFVAPTMQRIKHY